MRLNSFRAYPTYIEVFFITKFAELHIQNGTVVADFPCLSLSNLSENALTFQTRGWIVFLIVLMLHHFSWFKKSMDIFEFVSIE